MGKKKKKTNYRDVSELIGGISILMGFGYVGISGIIIQIYGTPETPDSLTGGWATGDSILNIINNIIFAPFIIILIIGGLFVGYKSLQLTKNAYNKLNNN